VSRVLLLSPAPLGPKMAGPAVRFFEFARHLRAAGLEVVLGSPAEPPGEFGAGLDFEVFHYHRLTLPRRLKWAEVVVLQGMVLRRHGFIRRAGRPLVVDLYDPIFLETLAHLEAGQKPDRVRHNLVLAQVMDTVAAGDFFLCASSKQRDFWLGFLAACNRVNPATFAQDPTLARLIEVVPFGLPEEAPVKSGPGLRALPGVGPGDRVVLWNGGVWDWLAPEPLVEAVGLLAPDLPDLKLVFMGVRNPDQALAESRAVGRVRRLVADLGLEGRVILNDWVAYQRRADFLLEAQVGACLYPAGLETDYSFRTRLLDCLWAGLPVLCSGGDALGELVAARGLGRVAADQRPESLARALKEMLADGPALAEMGRRARQAAGELTWPKVVGPLVEFCARPRPAPDKGLGFPGRPMARRPLGFLVKRTWEHLRSGTLWPALLAGLRIRRGG